MYKEVAAIMSNLDRSGEAVQCAAGRAEAGELESLATRYAELGGGMTVRRALPNRGRRLIGAWCFLDHFGPFKVAGGSRLDVPPHPHIGLQTVTWLVSGEVLHRDSLENEQLIRPGQLNLMTAGRGIAHSEESPDGASGELHGVQLWLALPDRDRGCEPAFHHHAKLPATESGAARLTVFAGAHGDLESPARVYSPVVGMELDVAADDNLDLPLNPGFEHGILVLDGALNCGRQRLDRGTLFYAAPGRRALALEARGGTRAIVVGGEPMHESVLLWWNFVARSASEMREAREDWEAHRRFGPVSRYPGERLNAPELSARLKSS